MKDSKNSDASLYEFAPLGKYSLMERIFIRVVGFLAYCLILGLGKTLRFDPTSGWDELGYGGREDFEDKDNSRDKMILAFWHDGILLLSYFLRNLNGNVMISNSLDGEYIARAAQKLGFGVIRGSASRNGTQALLSMVQLARRGKICGLTIDGPRGPRHKSKKGIFLLSRASGVPIIPMVIVSQKSWLINSWDQTIIPKPFSRAKVFFGSPLFVPPDADEDTVEQKRSELDQRLDELVAIGKEWRNTIT